MEDEQIPVAGVVTRADTIAAMLLGLPADVREAELRKLKPFPTLLALVKHKLKTPR
jgi:hypothetical protein